MLVFGVCLLCYLEDPTSGSDPQSFSSSDENSPSEPRSDRFSATLIKIGHLSTSLTDFLPETFKEYT